MGKVMYMRKGDTHTAPVGGLLASSLAVGSTVKLMENGTAVEYLVINQGIPSDSNLYDDSCNGTWLLRKDIYENRVWSSTSTNSYKASNIHSYLNSTFLNLFDSVAQAAIGEVKIPYVNGTGSGGTVASGESGLSTRVFLLSGYELGLTTGVSNMPADGAKLSYFASGTGTAACEKRYAYLDGTKTLWWMRSPLTNGEDKTFRVTLDGIGGGASSSNTYGVRPALIVPSNAVFDTETLILKGVA